MGEQLIFAGKKVSPDEAFDVVLGYAFASARGRWNSPINGIGDGLPQPTVPRWAYRTYDCIPADPSPRLQGIDLFVANGINARMSGRTTASMLPVVDEISAQLESLHEMRVPFWELDRDEVAEQPAEGDRAWPIWRTWTLLMGADHCDVAVTHKTLHHKRPISSVARRHDRRADRGRRCVGTDPRRPRRHAGRLDRAGGTVRRRGRASRWCPPHAAAVARHPRVDGCDGRLGRGTRRRSSASLTPRHAPVPS